MSDVLGVEEVRLFMSLKVVNRGGFIGGPWKGVTS